MMQHMAAAAARAESTATADGGGSTVVIGAEESLAATSLEAHASPLAPQQQVPAAAGAGGARPLSPAVAAGAGLGLGLPASTASGSVAGSSVSLTDVALLRRELGQAEGLIKAYQAENKAAAKRIKVGRCSASQHQAQPKALLSLSMASAEQICSDHHMCSVD